MMRVLVSAAMVAVTAASMAQSAAFDIYAADVMLLQAKQIQMEIGITEAQRKQMNAAAATHSNTLKALDTKYKGQKMSPELAKKVDPELARAFATLKTSVIKALKPNQVKRLRELSLQRTGISVLTDERVAKEVGMSAAQLKKFRDTYLAGGREATAIQQAAVKPIADKYANRKPKDEAEAKKLQAEVQAAMQKANQSVAPKLKNLETSTAKKLEAILTAAQRTKFKALLGKPFVPK